MDRSRLFLQVEKRGSFCLFFYFLIFIFIFFFAVVGGEVYRRLVPLNVQNIPSSRVHPIVQLDISRD